MVTIEAPREGVSHQRVVSIRGTISDPDVGVATLVHNGVSYRMQVRGGAFHRNLVMSPGQNFIEVFAENAKGAGRASVSLLSRIARSDVQVLMWWDADASDMDLWVTDPSGDRCWYQRRHVPSGGDLDIDVTDGFGPETFTMAKAVPGNYQVQVNYYGDRRSERAPIRVFVRVILFEGTDREVRKDYSVWATRAKEILPMTTFNVFPF